VRKVRSYCYCWRIPHPLGAFQGVFSYISASQLGGATIAGAVKKSGVKQDRIDELLMGCVLMAGQGQAPARQAGFAAGLDQTIPAVTINKICAQAAKPESPTP